MNGGAQPLFAQYSRVCIEAFGASVPPHRVGSRDLMAELAETQARLKLHPGSLEALTGIRERKFYDRGTRPSAVAAQAARQALERSGRSASDIQCILNTSVDRDAFEPSTSVFVHAALGAPGGGITFDISNACTGFMNGITTLASFIENGTVECGLVVDGEADGVRTLVDGVMRDLRGPDVTLQRYREQFAALTLGSGGAAAVLSSRERSRTGHRLVRSASCSATGAATLCVGQVLGRGNYVMLTRLEEMLREGIALVELTFSAARSHFQLKTVDHVFGHQVAARHTELLLRRLGLDQQKAHLIFPEFGNVGPAGLPLSLSLADQADLLREGDELLLLGCGSGLSCVIAWVTW